MNVVLLVGQTRYHYLVLNFKQDEEESIELPFTDEELKVKFDGRLEKEINGPTYEVISKILKALTGKKITMPGNFLGHSGMSGLWWQSAVEEVNRCTPLFLRHPSHQLLP